MKTQKNIEDTSGKLDRRDFLKGTSGLTFVVAIGANGVSLFGTPQASAGHKISAWVQISPDDSITIMSPAAEMGQGSMTGVPVILAEELDADWSKVVLEMSPADPDIYGYDSNWGKGMAIVGSRAVRMYFDQMRIAGAQARKILMMNVARKWNIPLSELKTEPSVVFHPASNRRISYGKIATFATVPTKIPDVDKSELKEPSEFRIIGKSVARRDIPAKVNGTAQYSIDVQLPNMVYASTIHSPTQEGEPLSWNELDIKALPGIIEIVKLRAGVAVIADSMENVLTARDELKVEWRSDYKAKGYDSVKALDEDYAKIASDQTASRQNIFKRGNDVAAFANASKTFEASFRSDYGYHAQMEPLNAVARFNADGTLEVWEGSQAPDWSRARLARALGLDISQVIHHQQYLGGGFGRRSNNDYAVEAALVAREIKRPVKLIWTREEDLAFGMFRPQALLCMEAAMDGAGNVTGWRQCVVGDGNRLLLSGIKIPYYEIPNQNIERRGISHNIRLKHWRAVAHPFNIFAHESFIDEMAAAEGVDPLEFRRHRMSMTDKARAVFDKVAEMSDWKAKRPNDRALGLSITERSGSLGAGVVEISLNRSSGQIRVHKVWLAVDGGIIVQPDAALRNVESGIIYGISSVLKERATIKDGVVEQSNFHDYEVLRMSETPEELHVEFMDRSTKPTGLGEIGNPFISAAIANAFYALTGKRLYHMPFTPERIKEVLDS